MRYIFIRIVICAAMLSFGGCSVEIFGGVESRSYYIMTDLLEEKSEEVLFKENSPQLVIRETSASRMINSQKIVFSGNPMSRGYYQYAYWFEPPAKRFSFLLRRRLEKVGYNSYLTEPEVRAQRRYQLNTELVDLYHDISRQPGEAIILVSAELVDLDSYQTLAKKDFQVSVPVQDYDAEGAIESFNKGTTEILSEISQWVDDLLKLK